MRKGAVLCAIGAALALAGQAGAKSVDPCWLLAHQATDPSAQTITVVNQANVKPANLCRVELAVQQQALQLRAAWGTPPIRFGEGGWSLLLLRSSAALPPSCDAGLGGCHDVAQDQPWAAVIARVDPWTVPTFPWSIVFSHEVLEMLVDPRIDRFVNGHLAEVCDPIATDYRLRGIYVADFTLPAYWTDSAGTLDELRVLTER